MSAKKKKPIAAKAVTANKDVPKGGITVTISVIAIIALTVIAFLPTFGNGYVFWDDPEYILHNPLMAAPLSVVFSSYYLANYHPLTILVYTFEHQFFGTAMIGYHSVSLLLHIANSLLVFFFIYHLLSKKNVMIPLVTALLFAIHPMHVESVAWASELKDVLYTFFFLASLLCYVFYVQKGRRLIYLLYALVLFLISLIAKGQAVTLPLCFLLVDFLFKRKMAVSMIAEKIPFFALSLIFGIVAIRAQDTAITNQDSTFIQNIFWGLYGLSLYLYKFILPINLSGLYPYPLGPGRSMPTIIYAAPAVIAVLLLIVFLFFRRDRFVLFGILFFLGNIITVLKFIPVGDAIIADRYSYIPFIGLFFVVAYGFNKLLNKPAFKPNKSVIQIAGVLVLVALSSLTWARTMVWKDSFTFWGDAIEKDGSYWRGWYCIGQEYYNRGDYKSAIKYYSGGIDNDKYCVPTVYLWRGATYLEKTHNYDSAIMDFKKVLDFPNKADPSQIEGRQNLGLAYYRKGMYDSALKTYNELIAMASMDTAAYLQRGLVYQYGSKPQPELALADYNRAIQMNPNYEAAYINRGSLYVDQMGKYDLGIADFDKTLEINPGNIDAFINKGVANYKRGNFDEAIKIYNQAIDKAADKGRVYYLEALAYADKKDYANAVQAAEQAQKLGKDVDPALLQEWKSKNGSR